MGDSEQEVLSFFELGWLALDSRSRRRKVARAEPEIVEHLLGGDDGCVARADSG